MIAPNQAEGAPGRSHLGTGDGGCAFPTGQAGRSHRPAPNPDMRPEIHIKCFTINWLRSKSTSLTSFCHFCTSLCAIRRLHPHTAKANKQQKKPISASNSANPAASDAYPPSHPGNSNPATLQLRVELCPPLVGRSRQFRNGARKCKPQHTTKEPRKPRQPRCAIHCRFRA